MIGLFGAYFDIVPEVLDVLAPALPAVPVALFAHGHLHPVLKARVILEQVEDVEPDLASEGAVVHAEEEPLGAPGGIDIFLQQQVVLMLAAAPAGHRQVSALEPALEAERGGTVCLDGRVQSGLAVEGLYACEGVVIGVAIVSAVGPVERLREEQLQRGLADRVLLFGLCSGEGRGEFEGVFGELEGGKWEEWEDGPGRDCALLLDRIGLGKFEQVLRLTLFHPAYYKIIINPTSPPRSILPAPSCLLHSSQNLSLYCLLQRRCILQLYIMNLSEKRRLF